MTRRLLALFVSMVVVATLAPSSSPANAGPAVAERATGLFRDGRGLEVVDVHRVGPRQRRLMLSTPELSRPVRVVVLLPRGYQRTDRRYPVLYLLHGTSGGATDWVTNGNVARSTRDLPLVVVMPDGGYDSNGGSWWTDWVDQETALGTANWETFHIRQLLPWIDDNLRTVRARHGRAIAGLSQGGFGAFSYAAGHPDLFVSAGSFSGAPDIARNPLIRTAGSAIVGATMTALNGVQPFAPFGDPATDAIVWKGHNPADLVRNLAATDLRLWTARGTPGELDEGTPGPGAVGIEAITHLSTRFFAQAADQAGVRYRMTDYGDGTHTWPYWSQHLREYLPAMMRVMAQRRARPARVHYRSIERVWRQWGWRVANRREPEHAWSALRTAGRGGFTLVADDDALVRTPKLFRPGTSYAVRYDGGTGPERVRANAAGRLRLLVSPTVEDPLSAGRVRVTFVR